MKQTTCILLMVLSSFCGTGQTTMEIIEHDFRLSVADKTPDSVRQSIWRWIADELPGNPEIEYHLDSIAKSSNDSLRHIAIAEIYLYAWKYYFDDDTSIVRAIQYIKEADKLISRYKHPDLKGSIDAGLGLQYFRIGLFHKSITHLKKAVEHFEVSSNEIELLNAYNDILSGCELIGDRDCIRNYRTKLKGIDFDSIPCETRVDLLEREAWDQFDENQFDSAIQLQLQLIQYSEECDTFSLNFHTHRLIRFLIAKEDYLRAKEILDTLRQKHEQNQDTFQLAHAYYQYGQIYEDKRQKKKAISAYNRCVDYAEKSNQLFNWPYNSVYGSISRLYEKRLMKDKAREFANKQEEIKRIKYEQRNREELAELRQKRKYMEENGYSEEEIQSVSEEIERLEEQLR